MTARNQAMPKRRNDPVGLRERVLTTAFHLFQENGQRGTSMQDIARSASVTHGALHHHFPTKKALTVAVIEEKVEAAFESTWLSPVREAPDPLRATFGVFRGLARDLDQRGVVQGCPINNLTLELASCDEDYRSPLRLMFARWRAELADALARHGRTEGGAARADATAGLIVAAYSGAMALAKAEQSGEPLRRCADELERLLTS